MTESIFIEQTANHIIQELAYLNNQIIGSDKVAFTALGMFLKLPITVEVHKYPNDAESKKLQLPDLMEVFSCYTDPIEQQVHFTFFYRDAKQLKYIAKIAKKQSIFFAYHYMKEVQHILRKHYTAPFQSMLLKKYKQRTDPHFTIKLACDYKVNNIMDSLFTQSSLRSEWSTIREHIAFNEDYKELSEIEIVKHLKKQSHKCLPVTNSDRYIVSEINGFKYITPKNLISGNIAQDIQTQNLANAIINVIRTNSKGTYGADIMIESFESIKTDAAWFDKLKGTITNTIYNKTNKHDRSWKNLKRTYRHIFKAPADVYADNKVNIILTIDQSGSIQINDLQKLLGIFESQSHKINELIVCIYDVDLVYTTKITSDFDISQSPKFKEALSKRYANGGTSIMSTIKYIDELSIKDKSKYICIKMSDNYDDGNEAWKAYPSMKKFTWFFLSPQNCPEVDTNICHGLNIKLP